MLPVIWRPLALESLDGIVEYIAPFNPRAALDLTERIERTAQLLADHPYLGREGRIHGTRELLPHPNYWLVYQVTVTCVEILAVVHARRQYP
ncbi:MAG: type II toxin-antitoxin system RelE/ParE family toxin [Pseudoxanthomonas sp.]